MFPWQERKNKSDGGYNVGEVLHGDSDEDAEESKAIHQMALKGIAHEIIDAVKMDDADKLCDALDLLCEVCISGYDKD